MQNLIFWKDLKLFLWNCHFQNASYILSLFTITLSFHFYIFRPFILIYGSFMIISTLFKKKGVQCMQMFYIQQYSNEIYLKLVSSTMLYCLFFVRILLDSSRRVCTNSCYYMHIRLVKTSLGMDWYSRGQ